MHIPSGFVEIDIFFTGNSLPTGAECTYAMASTASGDLNADAATLAGSWADNVMPNLSNDVVFDGLVLKENGVGGIIVGSYNANTVGGGGQSVAPGVCALAVKYTSMGGRGNKGRMYIPGVEQAAMTDDGHLDVEWRNDLTDGLVAWNSTITSTLSSAPYLLHSEGSALEDDPTPITGIAIASVVATQRRRQRR